MNFINDLFSEQILHAFGWTLVHSLWQGAIIALITGFLLLGLKKQSAKIRYFLAVGSLAAIFILSISTFIRYYSDYPNMNMSTNPVMSNPAIDDSQSSEEMDSFQPDELLENQAGIKAFYTKFADYFNRHFPILITIWFMGILFFLLKLMGGLIYSERIKHSGIKTLPDSWNHTISTLKWKMNIKRQVKVVESYLAKVPMVIGYFKPVILIPIGLLSGIPNDQLEAIIAHELAHIRRSDFLINIFQTIVESIFFYHPAVWWISGLVRKEREHCCDDMAVLVCDESLVYAKALANLQEKSIDAPYYAVAFARRNYSLLSRISRLNHKPISRNNPSEKWITMIAMMIVILSVLAAVKFPGMNSARAAANPIEEMSPGMFGLESFEPSIDIPGVELQDTLKKTGLRTINTTFFDASDQKDKEAKIIFEGKKLKELYIDGVKIPDDQIGNYQELIDNTLKELEEAEIELKKAREELVEAERALAEIDFEQIQQELETARVDVERTMQEMKEIDMEEVSREIDLAKEEIHRAMEQVRKIDKEEIQNQYQEMQKEFQESTKEFREEDWAKYQEEINLTQQKMQEAMSNFEMQDLNEKFKQMQLEFEHIWKELDTTKINQELRQSLQEMDRAMEHFNQEHMQEISKEMEKAQIEIQKSMQKLNQFHLMDREKMHNEQERQRQMQRAEAEDLRRTRETESRREYEQQMEARQREDVRRIQDAERRAQEAKLRTREGERSVRETERKENEAIRAIEKQLLIDGFYDDGEAVDFELSAKHLKIDGKKQPKKVFEKYKKIYEEQSGALPTTGTVMIKR